MYNHRLPGHPHITIPPGAGPPVNPSPQGYPPQEFEFSSPSGGDFLNPWDNRTPTVHRPNGRPGEVRSRSRTRSAYESVQGAIPFPEPELHRFASQRAPIHPYSLRHRPSKSDDGHDFDRDNVATPFTPATPSSASSIHYLHDDDVRVRFQPDYDVL